MSKMKVYELAKELGKSSKELLEFLGEKNIEVKSHMSSIEAGDVAFVKKAFGGKAETAKTDKPAEAGSREEGRRGAEGRAGRAEEKKYCSCFQAAEYQRRRQRRKPSGRTSDGRRQAWNRRQADAERKADAGAERKTRARDETAETHAGTERKARAGDKAGSERKTGGGEGTAGEACKDRDKAAADSGRRYNTGE